MKNQTLLGNVKKSKKYHTEVNTRPNLKVSLAKKFC